MEAFHAEIGVSPKDTRAVDEEKLLAVEIDFNKEGTWMLCLKLLQGASTCFCIAVLEKEARGD